VTLLGHFLGAEGRRARFAPDLAESVAWGDDRYRDLMGLIRTLVAARGLPTPEIPEPEPFDGQASEEIDLTGFGAVVFAGGFRPDYGGWVHVPGAFDDLGFPIHREGACTAASGCSSSGCTSSGSASRPCSAASARMLRSSRARSPRRPVLKAEMEP
jgi:putative flavoprotein involved in K+ transport